MDSAERDSSGKVYIKAAPTTIVVLIANTETSYLPVVRMVEILATASVFVMALVMLLVFLVCVLGVCFGCLCLLFMVYATAEGNLAGGILALWAFASIVFWAWFAWMLWHETEEEMIGNFALCCAWALATIVLLAWQVWHDITHGGGPLRIRPWL
jgi:hypothetical protein